MKINKRYIVIAAVLVLVGIVGFTVWRIWESYRAVEESSKSTKTTPQYGSGQKQDLTAAVNQKYGQKDYQGAIELIEGQANADDPSLQLMLAGAYANSGNVKKAYEIYKSIDDAGKLPKQELVNMADMAERAGQAAAAIALYKRAKEYAATTPTVSQDEIATYDYKIAELEKKQ